MKRIFSLFLLLGFLFFLLCFPNLSLTCAKTGLMLWFYTLLPSMLPFMILSGVLIGTGVLDKLLEKPKRFWETVFGLSPQGAYALLMGLFCGYPMGAKITAELCKSRRISFQEAEYLLTFVNHPGPSYLSGYLCIGLFQRADLILPTCLIVYTSSFLCSLFFRILYRKKREQHRGVPDSSPYMPEKEISEKEVSTPHTLGELLDFSILNSFEAITKLGGYIILFSILQGIFTKLLASVPQIRYILCALTEITTGSSLLAHSPYSSFTSYAMVLAFTSFGGLCVLAQTKSMLSGTKLSIKPYVKGKLFCLLTSFLLAYFLIKIVKIIVI